MIDRFAERSLQLANAGDDARVHERVEILKTICLIKQRAEFTQQLHVLFRKRRNVRFREDFEQRNFKGRKRNRAVESVAAALPLSGNARMSIQKRGHEVSLVAIGGRVVAMAREVAQQGL